jgi:[ribosomal protein S18]-alanine N-acetyltransferase
MPLDIKIAQATPLDAGLMAAIHATCFARPWDDASMAQFIAGPGTACLIGSVVDSSGATAAGFLIARRAADEAELLTLGVAPACRRAGLGRALLETAVAQLRSAGATRLFLEVEDGNAAALSLYRAFGASPVGRRKRYYETGSDAAIFSLALSDPRSDDGLVVDDSREDQR